MSLAAAALLVSIVSLVVSGLAFGWNVHVHLMAGRRSKAFLFCGLYDARSGTLVSAPVPRTGKRPSFRSVIDQGFAGDEMIGLRIVNLGSAAVTVEDIEVKAQGDGTTLHVAQRDIAGPPLPAEVLPGTNETWWVGLRSAEALVTAVRSAGGKGSAGAFMTARLGTGAPVTTRRFLRL